MEYALIKSEKVQNIIVADEDFIARIEQEWEHVERITPQEKARGVCIGWGWEGRFVGPNDAPAGPARRLSVLAFRMRFTVSERTAIEWAAVDRADQSEAQRMQAAELRATLADQAAAAFIDLDDGDTAQGVQVLEALGLLAQGRAAEILTAPVQPKERP